MTDGHRLRKVSSVVDVVAALPNDLDRKPAKLTENEGANSVELLGISTGCGRAADASVSAEGLVAS